jgi:hypothetical protein
MPSTSSKPIMCDAFPDDTPCEWCHVLFGEGEPSPIALACHCGVLHTLNEPHLYWLPAWQVVKSLGEKEGWSTCWCSAPEMSPDDCCDCQVCIGRRTYHLGLPLWEKM